MKENHPLLEKLRERVPEARLREAVECYREHRVKEVELVGDDLIGFVEGASMFDVEQTEVVLYSDGELAGACTCDDEERPCLHMLATLLAGTESGFFAFLDDQYGTTRRDAMRAVRRAGAREVAVDPLATDSGGYGAWKAQTMAKRRPSSKLHRVEIFSRAVDANQCTCRSFEYDQLGTCRHIEGVLHQVGRDETNPPRSVVYVDWSSGAPVVRVHWSTRHAEEPPSEVARFFDSDGVLDAPLDACLEKLEASTTRRRVSIGLDVRQLQRNQQGPNAGRRRRNRVRKEMKKRGRSSGFLGTLRPFQEEGVRFLVERGRAMLADEMGLGKTVQAIAAADWLIDLGEVERVLVICPASVKHQWASEIARFTDHQVTVVTGPKAQRLASYREQTRFAVANYELVMRDAPQIERGFGPTLLIVDEAQRIKNRATLTADALKTIRTPFCFALTGTPVENRPGDLFSLMELIEPTALGPHWQFERVGVPEMYAAVSPYLLRRRRDVLEDALPERHERDLVVKNSRRQIAYQDGKLQEAARIRSRADKAARPMTPGEHAAFMGKLCCARMASNSMFLMDERTKHSPKVKTLLKLVDDFVGRQGRKMVVFSEWIASVELAREALNNRGIRSLFLHGGVPSARRGELIEQFADRDDTNVFFSTEAGGVGLNLQMASVVVNMELPWNPARLAQRIGRVHRLGQTRTVDVVNLIGTGYEQMRMVPMLAEKRALAVCAIEPEFAKETAGHRMRELGYSVIEDDFSLDVEISEVGTSNR